MGLGSTKVFVGQYSAYLDTVSGMFFESQEGRTKADLKISTLFVKAKPGQEIKGVGVKDTINLNPCLFCDFLN